MAVLGAAVLAGCVWPAHGLACVKSHRVQVANGVSPSRGTWKISAKVKSNEECETWLFSIKFQLPRIVNWGSEIIFPVGSHLPDGFMIKATDAANGKGQAHVFSGYTGRRIATVVASMSDGERLELHPLLPAKHFRRRLVWMRGFKYFVHYYHSAANVVGVSAWSRSGRLLYKAKRQGGFFE